jgi:hypothetical protein
MLIALRIVGLVLVLLGASNLVGMFAIDLSMLTSPVAVALRYSLMVVAGVGFLLAYKWAIFVYLGSFAANWSTFFFVYDGQSLGPLWLTSLIPILVVSLTYFAWGKLKPIRTSDASNKHSRVMQPMSLNVTSSSGKRFG